MGDRRASGGRGDGHRVGERRADVRAGRDDQNDHRRGGREPDGQPTRSFQVSLSNPTNAVISRGTATGTILDNDSVPNLSIDDATVAEGNSGSQPLQFTVTLSEAS